MSKTIETQKTKVWQHIYKYGHITQEEAQRLYKISRLASIIHFFIHKRQLPIKKHLEFNPNDHSHHWMVYEIETVTMP